MNNGRTFILTDTNDDHRYMGVFYSLGDHSGFRLKPSGEFIHTHARVDGLEEETATDGSALLNKPRVWRKEAA